MKHRFLLILFFSLFTFHFLSAQNLDSTIHISGKVYEAGVAHPDLTGFMVVNLRTQQGFFGQADGSFSFDIRRNDSLIVAALGYEYVKMKFSDSVYRPNIQLNISLKRKQVQLPEVRIIAPRDLEAIQKDIEKLGYNKKDYELSGINALESPITFLYEELSQRERLRRHNAEVVNEQKRRNLLKELLSRYVADDIVQLSDNEFDRFIDFCDVSEEYLKTATQYDFMVYIKTKYELFTSLNDYYRRK